jgi:hypothetical protein
MVKHGKNPTLKQKLAIQACKLNPENWLVYQIEAGQLHIVNRISGKTRIIPGR